MKKKYTLRGEVWLYPSETAAWHFVSIDKSASKKIKDTFGKNARGFGSLPVIATIGKTAWKTSIFPDKKLGSYLLPLKADVRKKEGVYEKDNITFSVEL